MTHASGTRGARSPLPMAEPVLRGIEITFPLFRPRPRVAASMTPPAPAIGILGTLIKRTPWQRSLSPRLIIK